MKIITAHDGKRHYADMAYVAYQRAQCMGHALDVKLMNNVKHAKAALLGDALHIGTTVWMDADSMLVGSIDEIFDTPFDVAFALKEPEFASSRYGSHLYSGFVVAQNSITTFQFLRAWSMLTTHASDQRNLHIVLGEYLSAFTQDRIGHTIDCDGLRIKLLDPNDYVHQRSIHDMVPPPPEAKIIHFKGALHKKWPEYKKMMCW